MEGCALVVSPYHDGTKPVGTVAILGPDLRQKQLGIDQGLVTTVGHSQMHRDDTVVEFARVSAPLPLDARSLGSLFRRAGLVDDSDRAEIVRWLLSKPFGDVPLHQAAALVFMKDMVAQKLLQRSDRHTAGHGDRLNAFASQVASCGLSSASSTRMRSIPPTGSYGNG